MKVVIDDEKLMDLLEIQWGYEGIREDVQRVLRENSVPYEPDARIECEEEDNEQDSNN